MEILNWCYRAHSRFSPEIVRIVILPEALDEEVRLSEEVLCRRHGLPRPLESIRLLLRYRHRRHRGTRRRRRRLLARETI